MSTIFFSCCVTIRFCIIFTVSSIWCSLSLDSKMLIGLTWALNILFSLHAYPNADLQPNLALVFCFINIHGVPTMHQTLFLALVRKSRRTYQNENQNKPLLKKFVSQWYFKWLFARTLGGALTWVLFLLNTNNPHSCLFQNSLSPVPVELLVLKQRLLPTRSPLFVFAADASLCFPHPRIRAFSAKKLPMCCS